MHHSTIVHSCRWTSDDAAGQGTAGEPGACLPGYQQLQNRCWGMQRSGSCIGFQHKFGHPADEQEQHWGPGCCSDWNPIDQHQPHIYQSLKLLHSHLWGSVAGRCSATLQGAPPIHTDTCMTSKSRSIKDVEKAKNKETKHKTSRSQDAQL
jgi:hypothetical protein